MNEKRMDKRRRRLVLELKWLICGGDKCRLSNAAIQFSATLSQLTTLQFPNSRLPMTDDGLAPLALLSKLRRVDLQGGTNATGVGMMYLTRLDQLTHLVLSRGVDDEGAEIIASSLVYLKALKLCKCGNLTGLGFEKLFGHPGLETLQVIGAKLGQLSRAATTTATRSITALDLSRCKLSEGNSLLQHIITLPLIRILILEDCAGVDDQSIACLAALKHLQRLRMATCRLSDACLVHLMALPMLQELDLSDNWRISGSGFVRVTTTVTDDSKNNATIIHKRLLPELRTLILLECTEVVKFSGICAFHWLEALDLFRSRSLRDEDLTLISSSLTGLTTLDIGECDRITDAGVAALTSLGSLTNLRFGPTDALTDSGMLHVAKLLRLTELTVWGCDITEVSLHYIAESLPLLTYVDLRGCTYVNSDVRLSVFGGFAELEVVLGEF